MVKNLRDFSFPNEFYSDIGSVDMSVSNTEITRSLIMLIIIGTLPIKWNIIEKIVQMLKLIKELTMEHSFRNAVTSLIILSILALQIFLQKSVSIDQDEFNNFSGILTIIYELLISKENI